MSKSSVNFQMSGHLPAYRDAIIRFRNEATGAVLERKPFLDGSLLIRDLDPGPYELEVRHPNLVNPIELRRIRLFPQPTPIRIPIPIPANLFRDSPIRDIPDADLAPIQQVATDIRNRLLPIGGKAPGEAIRAADWNTLVGAVSDLSSAVLELTNLVSPRGHDHPEIAEKIGEVQGNLRRFAQAFGKSLLELRREIATLSLRKNVTDVLDAGQATTETRDLILERVDELETLVQTDTPLFTQKLSNAGNLIQTEINNMAVALGDEVDTFLSSDSVKKLKATADTYSTTGTQTRIEDELLMYDRDISHFGSKMKAIIM